MRYVKDVAVIGVGQLLMAAICVWRRHNGPQIPLPLPLLSPSVVGLSSETSSDRGTTSSLALFARSPLLISFLVLLSLLFFASSVSGCNHFIDTYTCLWKK